ncbi:MAG: DUF2797 domain-containing protein [Desulfobulbaceae bacterium]|nr:DUF2797 domain-containing protein [Desulfobulbaceae bacterium]
MSTSVSEEVRYELILGEDRLLVNDLIGQRISIRFEGVIHCKKCGRETKKSFQQGFCYPCFKNAPQASECIIKPELCRGHMGEGRDVEWESANHVQPHIVYLAVASSVKVGVTRAEQIPGRWIDQGASYAIKLAQTPNRYLAGLIEVELKQHFTDKTSWVRMLKNEVLQADLQQEKTKALSLLPEEMRQYQSADDEITTIRYPVLEYPVKVKSIGLDKVNAFSGKLLGIKGQYLLFDSGRVFNVRKHSGYLVELQGFD